MLSNEKKSEIKSNMSCLNMLTAEAASACVVLHCPTRLRQTLL